MVNTRAKLEAKEDMSKVKKQEMINNQYELKVMR